MSERAVTSGLVVFMNLSVICGASGQETRPIQRARSARMGCMRLGSVRAIGFLSALLMLGACGADQPQTGSRSAEPSVIEDQEETKVPANPGKEVAAKVIDTDFMPRTLRVEKGSTVLWEQVGDQPHSVTAADDSFDSNPDCGPVDSEECLGQGDEFSHTFETTGTFIYYCRVHGLPDGTGMVGKIVVR